MELFEMTAASLSEKLRKKECSAVEITRSVLEQIEKTEDKIGSFVTVCEEPVSYTHLDVYKRQCP